MRHRTRTLLLFIFCNISLIGFAQEDKVQVIHELLEAFEIKKGSHNELESRITHYQNLLEQPISLNSATKEELRQLQFLNPIEILEIIHYRKKFGNFLSFQELNALENLSPDKIKFLKAFARIDETEELKFDRKILKQQILLRLRSTLEEKDGFKNNKYEGSPVYQLLKYRLEYAGYELGITLEKDAGEKWELDKHKFPSGFDYNSFYFSLKPSKYYKKLILGNYKVSTGEGLVLGNTFGVSKTSNSIGNGVSKTTGIQASRSSTEYGFLQGLAIEYEYKKIKLRLFTSLTKEDANLNSEDTHITSILKTGFHRTENEKSKRKKLTRELIGFNAEYKANEQIRIGMNQLHTTYSLPIPVYKNSYSKEIDYQTKVNLSSLYANYSFRNFHAFGEFAMTKEKKHASVVGFLHQLSTATKVLAKFRFLSEKFFSPNGNIIQENNHKKEEQGVYLGIKTSISSRFSLEAYLDRFSFPKGLLENLNSFGAYEFMLAGNYDLNPKTIFRVLYREKKFDILNNKTKRRLDLSYKHLLEDFIELKGKVTIQNQNSNFFDNFGYSLIQDIKIRFSFLSFKTRFAIFEIDDFENRIYNYEPDLLYSFSMPFFYQKGFRYFLLIGYKPNKSLNFGFKFARSTYPLKESLSSGNEKINTNHKTGISFQCLYKF